MFTPVDPLFLVIDCLFTEPRRFLPANQLFSDLSGRVKRSGMPTPGVTSSKGSGSLAGTTWDADAVHWVQSALPRIVSAQLPLIMDINDSMGADSLLYRLSDAKVALWLAAKAVATARHLQATSEAQGGGAVAVSNSFSLTSDANAQEGPEAATAAEGGGAATSGGGLPTAAWLEEGLDLLAEYAADAPLALARAKLGLGADSAAPATAAAATGPAAASGNGGERSDAAGDADSSAASLQKAAAWASAGNSGSSLIDPSKYRAAAADDMAAVGGVKRKPETVQSSAAKRLAKTDTSGMKSMLSFFKSKK